MIWIGARRCSTISKTHELWCWGVGERELVDKTGLQLGRVLDLRGDPSQPGFGKASADPDRVEEFAVFASLATGWGEETEGELIDLVLQSANEHLQRGGTLGPGFSRFLTKGRRLRAWRKRAAEWANLDREEYPVARRLSFYRKRWFNRKRYVIPSACVILVAMVFWWFWFPHELPLPTTPFAEPIRYVDLQGGEVLYETMITQDHPVAAAIEQWCRSDHGGWRPSVATYVPDQSLYGQGFVIQLWPEMASHQGMVRSATDADRALYEALASLTEQQQALSD